MTTATIRRSGMLTTVQDLGRWGYQGMGVPVAGPMDAYSHRAANRIVGNDDNAAALEITLIGPEIEFDGSAFCAVAGAMFDLTVDGVLVSTHAPFEVGAGSVLRFGERRAGARAVLAVRGGFDVEADLGSRATSLVSRMGPFGGRALKAGDALPVGATPGREAAPAAIPDPLRLPAGGATLRVMAGPHREMFKPAALHALYGGRYTITTSSNRMGYRLAGTALDHLGTADILSDATPIGSIQVPASGQPILLMADRQTTGGYPKIATVISADLPIAGQLAPGDWIEFAPCAREEAIAALRERLAGLERTA